MMRGMETRLPDPAMISITPADDDPAYKALIDELAKFEERLAETRARRQRAQALRRGVPAGRPAFERAKDLLKGGTIPALDPDRELAACDEEEFGVLRPAITELNRQIADRRGDLSLAACRKVEAQHTAAIRAMFRAIEDLNVALGVAAGIRARVKSAGYLPLESLLPAFMPPALLALNTAVGGQVWLWRQILERHGVIIS